MDKEVQKTILRISLALIVVPSLVYTGLDIGLVSASSSSQDSDLPHTISESELKGATLIASQSGSLSVASQGGTIIARMSAHDAYFDVDRVESLGSATVLYAAVDIIPRDECGWQSKCVRNVVETYNLTTGETKLLYEQTIPDETAPQWHDADYIGDGKIVVADMSRDRVFIANTTTGIITWQWQAGQAFDPSSGGDNPQDWTHLNDVEALPGDRIMVSMRNQDQLIFINNSEGVDESWTLGEDRDPSATNRTLYAQHNPDYITPENGGPAVLVADSEQDRIVEFQRTESGWTQTWEYGVNLGWPRDADRLPNGHTLITDSHNKRVIEINERNEIVWQANAPLPYDAERIGTGQESSGGESAIQLGLSSATESSTDDSLLGRIKALGRQIFPGNIVNAISFVNSKYPISFTGMAAAAVSIPLLCLWMLLEFRWSDYIIVPPIKKK